MQRMPENVVFGVWPQTSDRMGDTTTAAAVVADDNYDDIGKLLSGAARLGDARLGQVSRDCTT